MQWETDLIGYDAMKSYGSPAYYAQVMFSSYIGDHTLASQVEGAGTKFFYSITGNAAKKKLYLKLVNADSTAQAVKLKMTGRRWRRQRNGDPEREDTQATNTIDNPAALVPVESTLMAGANMRHIMPGYSIQVIEFDEE